MFSTNIRDNRQTNENNTIAKRTTNYNDRRREEREYIGFMGVPLVWDKSPPQPTNE